MSLDATWLKSPVWPAKFVVVCPGATLKATALAKNNTTSEDRTCTGFLPRVEATRRLACYVRMSEQERTTGTTETLAELA
jgi:hypothetical protein